MQPSVATLENIVTVAQSAAAQTVSAASAIQLGGPQNLSNTYNQLISSNTRLIFLNQIDPTAPLHSTNNTVKYDSYSPTAYATITVGPILQALAAMNTAGQAGADYTVLQLQGTASSGQRCGGSRHDRRQLVGVAADDDQALLRLRDLPLGRRQSADQSGLRPAYRAA
jgi:hypothetical protein